MPATAYFFIVVLAVVALPLSGQRLNPAQPDLQVALTAAEAAWGFTIPEHVHIEFAPLNECSIAKHDELATTTVLTKTSRMVITDAGDTDVQAGEQVGEETTSYEYQIRVNSNCRWSQHWLNQVVTHEFGHILLGAQYHSADKRSIMFWIVTEKSDAKVLDADRAHVKPGSAH